MVMKPCHETNGGAIYVERAVTKHNPWSVSATLLKSKVVRARSRPKIQKLQQRRLTGFITIAIY